MRRSTRRPVPLLLALALLAVSAVHLCAPVAAAHQADTAGDDELIEREITTVIGGDADDGAEGADDAAQEDVDESDVLVLTEKTFADAIKKHKNILVEFYAPWCGHCQSLKPEYAKAATALKSQGLDAALAKVDATAEPALGEKYGVQGYPTLKWFVDGEPLEYGGGRTEPDIVRWIKKKTGPPAQTVESAEELQKAVSSSKAYALGYFKSFEGDAHKVFEDAARAIDEVEVYQTTSAEAAKAAGLAKEGLVVVKTFEGEEMSSVYPDALSDKDAVRTFVKSEKVPPYVWFTEENQPLIFESGIKLNVIVVGPAEQFAKGSPVTKAVLKAAAAQKGKVIYVLADRDGPDAEPILEFFNLKKDLDAKDPQVVGFNMESTRKYVFSEAFSEAALTKFGGSMADGSLKPHFASEDIPKEPTEDGITVVVGKNFDDIVLDQSKDVLLEAYAPWCGHCKALAPTWVKLAGRFNRTDSVVIAKIEAQANEHEALKVDGFPGIFLYPSGKDQTPIPYAGYDRSLKALTAFLKENAKKAVSFSKDEEAAQEAEDKDDEEAAKKLQEAEDEMPPDEEGADGLPEGMEMDVEGVDGMPEMPEGEDPELTAAEDAALDAEADESADAEAAAETASDEL